MGCVHVQSIFHSTRQGDNCKFHFQICAIKIGDFAFFVKHPHGTISTFCSWQCILSYITGLRIQIDRHRVSHMQIALWNLWFGS